MKNKKGGKAQKFINTVQKQSESSGKNKEAVSEPFQAFSSIRLVPPLGEWVV
jgi:hypothetical protein